MSDPREFSAIDFQAPARGKHPRRNAVMKLNRAALAKRILDADLGDGGVAHLQGGLSAIVKSHFRALPLASCLGITEAVEAAAEYRAQEIARRAR